MVENSDKRGALIYYIRVGLINGTGDYGIDAFIYAFCGQVYMYVLPALDRQCDLLGCLLKGHRIENWYLHTMISEI